MDNEPKLLQFEEWSLDIDKKELIGPDGERSRLTRTEIKVLNVFIQNPEKVLTIDELLALGWGNTSVTNESVRKAVSHLRANFTAVGVESEVIDTRHGLGYIFVATPKQPLAAMQVPLSSQDRLSPLSNQRTAGREPQGWGVQLRIRGTFRRKQVLTICAALLILGGAILLASRAYPYAGFSTSVHPSEVEARTRGLVSVFAQDIRIGDCETTFNTTQSDWHIEQLIKIKGLTYTRSILSNRGTWSVDCGTQELGDMEGVFDSAGNLDILRLPSPPGGNIYPVDYRSHIAAATEIAERVFRVSLEGHQPIPFYYDGHDYLEGNSHFDLAQGAPFEWTIDNDRKLQIKLNSDGRLLYAMRWSTKSDIPRELHYLYSGLSDPPRLRQWLRLICTLIVGLIGFFQIVRLRKVLFRRAQLLLPGIIGFVLPAIFFKEALEQIDTQFSELTIDPPAALGLVKWFSFAFGLILVGGVSSLLIAVAAQLSERTWPTRKLFPSLRSVEIRKEIGRQVLEGLFWAAVYLFVHCAVLLAMEKIRLGSWTSLWIVDGTLQHQFLSTIMLPITLGAQMIVVLIILFSTLQRVIVKSPWGGTAAVALFLVVGQYTFPEAVGIFMSSASATVIFALLQAVAVVLIARKGEMAKAYSFVMSVSTFLLAYPFLAVFWRSSIWTVLCLSGVSLLCMAGLWLCLFAPEKGAAVSTAA